MSRANSQSNRNPFRPGMVALVLFIGAAAFMLLLYAIGQGWTGGQDRNGGEHAASTGLTGFSGLYKLLEEAEHAPSLSRSEAGYDDYGLLVLTPPHFSDGEEIAAIIEERRYIAPTMLVLPKWYAMPIPDGVEVETKDGWVVLGGSQIPQWFADLGLSDNVELVQGATRGWNGMGLRGSLPEPNTVQALKEQENLPGQLQPLVVDSEGDMLAGITYFDDDAWPLVVVIEPDLLNNYGMADETRARLAHALIHEASDGEDLPEVFDLTLSGLGSSANLLTLAFTPPFLAATLCLLLAALVIAWRGFRRFGPPRAEAPAMAQGKQQLALNGAALIGRVRRWHLLAEPYAALITARIAAKLGLREHGVGEHGREAREAAIDRALTREGHDGPGFARAAHNLRNAGSAGEILRAARALRSLERTLDR